MSNPNVSMKNWSPERRARWEAKVQAKVGRTATRIAYLESLEDKALKGEAVTSEDLKRIAIADALVKLRSAKPTIRAEGQRELEALHARSETPKNRGDNMRPVA